MYDEEEYNKIDQGRLKDKSRDLSPLEYLKVLQYEWWICNLRRKIYPAISDKNYYNKVANKKRDRIKEICETNDIDSIFSNQQMMKDLNKTFMKFGGMPIFEGMKEEDVINYYLPGNDVRCFYGFSENKPNVKIGKIESFDLKSQLVTVSFENGQVEKLPITKVSRIV